MWAKHQRGRYGDRVYNLNCSDFWHTSFAGQMTLSWRGVTDAHPLTSSDFVLATVPMPRCGLTDMQLDGMRKIPGRFGELPISFCLLRTSASLCFEHGWVQVNCFIWGRAAEHEWPSRGTDSVDGMYQRCG